MAISTEMMSISRERQRYEQEMYRQKMEYEREMMRQQMMRAPDYYPHQLAQEQPAKEVPKQTPLLLLL